MAAARLGLRVLATSLQQFQRNVNRVLPVTPNLRSLSLSHRLLTEKRFSADHEWIEVSGNVGTVGITDYAQTKLGELVYVELPDVGSTVDKDDVVGAVESVKAAADILSPCSGSILEINSALTGDPSLINKAAMSDGWFFKLELSAPAEVKDLMNEEAYKSFIETLDE